MADSSTCFRLNLRLARIGGCRSAGRGSLCAESSLLMFGRLDGTDRGLGRGGCVGGLGLAADEGHCPMFSRPCAKVV